MKTRRKAESVCVALAALALAGCGDSDSTSTLPPPAPASITIAGTAVQGAALGGAAVSVKCSTGTGTATTAASGAYTSTITGGALPCAVKVVGTSGTTYHSLVAGTGNTGTFTANVSPLTEMVVSHVGGADPAAYFSAFGSTSTVTTSSVADANAYVQTAMAGLTDLTGVNPLTDALVVGNAHDQKIDAVVAGIAAAGLAVADVTAAIVQNPAAPSVIATPLAPSAADCAWLKSGTYRLIARTETDPEDRFGTIQIDAAALSVNLGTDGIWPMTSDGACQFNIDFPDGTVKLMASSGGMIVIHFQGKVASDRVLIVGMPEQTLPVAEFAGTWNYAAWLPASIPVAGSVVAAHVEAAIDATGQVTDSKGCVGLFPCAPGSPPFGTHVTNPDGGFDFVVNGAVASRVFLYKTLAGRKVAMGIRTADNAFNIGVPMNPLSLPAVGTVTSFSIFQINGDNSVSALTADTTTITATDSNARTATRLLSSNNRVDMITYDKPRDGLRHRALNSCTVNNAPVNCAETVQLPLPDMGIVISLSAAPKPTQQFYQFSVFKP